MTLSLTLRRGVSLQLISPLADRAQTLFPPSAKAGTTGSWNSIEQAWTRGHGPGSFFPRGSQGPWSPRTRETLALGTAHRGLRLVSPGGLNRQSGPSPGPQHQGRDAPEAAQSPERRHLAPPQTAGRRTGRKCLLRASCGLLAYWHHSAALLEAGGVAEREPDNIRVLHPGFTFA